MAAIKAKADAAGGGAGDGDTSDDEDEEGDEDDDYKEALGTELKEQLRVIDRGEYDGDIQVAVAEEDAVDAGADETKEPTDAPALLAVEQTVGDAPEQQSMMSSSVGLKSSSKDGKAPMSPEEASAAAAKREALQVLHAATSATKVNSPKDRQKLAAVSSLERPALQAASSVPTTGSADDDVPALKSSLSSPRALRGSPRSPEKEE